MKFVFCLSVLLFSTLTYAKINPVKLFEEKATTTFTSCNALISLKLMARHDAKFKPYCGNTEDVEEVKALYKAAKSHLESEGNGSGIEELKNFYAYWKTNMDTILPEPYESKALYENRTAKRKVGLRDKANLLQIEADY